MTEICYKKFGNDASVARPTRWLHHCDRIQFHVQSYTRERAQSYSAVDGTCASTGRTTYIYIIGTIGTYIHT